ncbi:MAG: radical SAM protein [Chloroflexi bacterium]|nr:radical SAM protein [Chloroflexota bacterium]
MIGITKLLCGVETPGDDLRYRGDGSVHRRPVVVWNMTRRCNLHCVHCYASAVEKPSPDELTTAEGKALMDSLAAYGVPVILFSGGEPLTRPDLLELTAYASSKGLRSTYSTNGTLITPSQARDMKQANITYVGVSLDGLEAANDRFRGKKGAFKEALNGIRHCREAGVKVGLRFTITRQNRPEIPAILDLIESENIPRVCFYHLVYAGRGSKMVEADLTHQEARETIDLIMARAADFHRRGLAKEILTVDNYADGVYLYLQMKRENPERAAEVFRFLKLNGGNNSGVGIGCIDHEGNVHPDQFWRHYSFGNIRQRSFGDIWEDTSDPVMKGLKNRRAMVKGRCARCQFLELCGGNFRVRAEAVYGDIWAPDPACYLTDQEIGIAQ